MLDRAMAKGRAVCPSVCLSVRLSHLWATPKRFNRSKYFYTHTVEQYVSSFLLPIIFVVVNLGSHPELGRETEAPLLYWKAKIWPIIKRGNCECIATWDRPTPRQSLPPLLMTLKLPQRICCCLKAFLLLIRYARLWPWPLTLRPRHFTFDLEHL